MTLIYMKQLLLFSPIQDLFLSLYILGCICFRVSAVHLHYIFWGAVLPVSQRGTFSMLRFLFILSPFKFF